MDEFWSNFGIKPIVYWTDAIIYFMMVASALWMYFALKRAFWIQAFKQLASNRLAMLCVGVMSLYAVIGFLDTLHFKKYEAENKVYGRTISVLDAIGKRYSERVEKTYSVPFATHAFTMETEIAPDGKQVRVHHELKFGGEHLRVDGKYPEGEALEKAKAADIRFRIVKGVGYGLVLGLLGFGILFLLSKLIKPAPADTTGLTDTSDQRAKWVLSIGLFWTITSIFACTLWILGSGYHILGTDQTGGDIFWMSIKGTRTGLILGALTTLIVTPFAILFGVMAGYYGGWVDNVITYVYSTLSSIPDILLIAAAMLIVQGMFDADETPVAADKKLVLLCIIMGITSWTGLCRLLRAETLKLRQSEFVQAADAFGIGRWTIMFRHLVPNVSHLVIISVATSFSSMVLTESVLSYIGIGVDPSMSSWGNQINGARMELAYDPAVWWNLAGAFIFCMGLVLPANLFGDAVRDALDPKLRTV